MCILNLPYKEQDISLLIALYLSEQSVVIHLPTQKKIKKGIKPAASS